MFPLWLLALFNYPFKIEITFTFTNPPWHVQCENVSTIVVSLAATISTVYCETTQLLKKALSSAE